VWSQEELKQFTSNAAIVSPDHPVVISKFMLNSLEVDVDAIADGETVFIGGVMEHIEMAGVHSGDSSMSIPPFSLSDTQLRTIREATRALAQELNVRGLMNIQFAVKGSTVYVLEVNPRASRTSPFVSKAIGIPLAKIASRVMVGRKIKEFGLPGEIEPNHFSIKESVFPFRKFAGVDIIRGPEMKSTGEVMGIDVDFGRAYAKAELAAGHRLPSSGNVFISVKDSDKRDVIYIAKRLEDLGFHIIATSGTARVLQRNGISARSIFKIKEGRPNPIDLTINREIDLIINTPSGKGPKTDEANIRSFAIAHDIHVITTIAGAQAAVNAIESMRKRTLEVRAMQDYHPSYRNTAATEAGHTRQL
ncbi:MAG: ATP-grasp domain-containing protein, partial [Planctomycetota bacterium]|nr:ATP-grasp domain-containing protein [Planctomycetota bacterium]